MKTPVSLLVLSLSGSLLALSITGCSSWSKRTPNGPDASQSVSGKTIDLLQFRENVRSTELSLKNTIDALKRVPSSANSQAAYDKFSAELAVFRKISATTLNDSAVVRNSGNDLFAKWQLEVASIHDPEIRATAEKRRLKLQDSYNSILPPLVFARTDLTQVESTLVDLQKALALDLTPAGLDATKKLIDRAEHEAETSIDSLDNLEDKLDDIADILPPATITPAK